MTEPSCRVLVADDDPTVAVLLPLTLRAPAFALSFVKNGRLAVDACRQQEFDIVVLDVEMPELDGLAAAAQIRACCGDALPIVLMTGREDSEFTAACRTLGARHLAKPVDWSRFAGWLRTCAGLA